MPIVCKDYTWTENIDEVNISVPLKGVKGSKADIYSNEVYLKVNYPPHIFEADLLHPVDDLSSCATIGNGAVLFKLRKKTPELWGALLLQADKAELRARRAEAEKTQYARNEELEQQKVTEARERKQRAVQKQMDIDAAERKKLEDLKDSARKEAADDMDKLADSASQVEIATPSEKKFVPKQPVRDVRTRGKIEIKFTDRAFVTAARESHAVEEEEWLAKQAAAAKRVQEAKQMAKDAGVENDPLWLKDKGNEFFAAGNFESAINAYTAAVSIDVNMHGAYSNRAACHLKLKDYQAAAMDSSKALSLLTPPVEENKKSRLRAHSRRAAALTALEDYEAALDDLVQALKIDPDNASLEQDRLAVKAKVDEKSAEQGQEQSEELD